MIVTIRRIDVWTALRFGLLVSPVVYTLQRVIIPFGGLGVSLGDYLGGLIQSIIVGAVVWGGTALVYNLVAARFGPIRLELDVHATQNPH